MYPCQLFLLVAYWGIDCTWRILAHTLWILRADPIRMHLLLVAVTVVDFHGSVAGLSLRSFLVPNGRSHRQNEIYPSDCYHLVFGMGTPITLCCILNIYATWSYIILLLVYLLIMKLY